MKEGIKVGNIEIGSEGEVNEEIIEEEVMEIYDEEIEESIDEWRKEKKERVEERK